jgi:hypothetical protein
MSTNIDDLIIKLEASKIRARRTQGTHMLVRLINSRIKELKNEKLKQST